ncbi:GNAT family N-acetyltransferase [Nocardia huaxiensis]|uniref:GNAT family N-acetyltransferase n=1 Tax=Nocardia huaxiensis TaxID=2755382 RepID=A0A7D6ZE89_9NOCA|nr:GNAT family N-acetyltransferase [Nocardia huaxiensis]QLY28000.1 GNAT family N-acetyltransferase [Nocardia huaxiensis]UFS98594.1 GNAT family N-acetyltransferase [Nocardia huaxiensis]
MTPSGNRQRYVEAVNTYVATHLVRADESSREGDASSWFRTGGPSDELNGVLRLGGDLPYEIARLRDLFDGVPASWHVWREIDPPEIAELLARHGLAVFETEPLMVFTDKGSHLALGQGELARIEEVSDESGLAQWAALWSGVPGAAALAAGLRQAMRLGSTRYLVWREHGAVLGCAAVVTSAAGASIEHIVTRADRRGRGIGTALTQRALELALESGSDHVVLTASPDGEHIYRRLGFVTVGHVDRYA